MRFVLDLNYVGFIYLWTSKIDGMKYLGSHKGHINDGYVGSGLRFKAAVNKYGIENFDRIIVDFCYSDDEIKNKEQFYLDHYKCAQSNNFYNISYSSCGGNMGQDYKLNGQKISLANRKNGCYEKHSKRLTDNNPNAGGRARRVYNKNNRSPNLGYSHTDEAKRLMREQKLGDKNPNKDGLVGRLETWLVNINTGEIEKYGAQSKAEAAHNANHAAVYYHRTNDTKSYRGYKWYVGDEINQIKFDYLNK